MSGFEMSRFRDVAEPALQYRMWNAFDEEAERSDRYTRTAYFDEEFRSQSGSSTKRKRNSFQMCGQSEFVHAMHR
uniref:Uncharacterized protein n=1 Tax=Caenorhabditis japonica TaxID=281687 RepID=A0A8R1IH60_CAEJA